MVGVKEIRTKLISIQNTQKITKTMEMLAASKMRKTQERMVSSRPYIETMRKIIAHFTLSNLGYQHPYLVGRKVKRVGYLVVATDRGLAGGLNVNVFKKLLLEMKIWNKENVEIELALIGSKAIPFFDTLGSKVIAQVAGMGDNPTISKLLGPIKVMLKAYDKGWLDKLYIISNKFVNTILQVPQTLQILPLPLIEQAHFKQKSWDYLYETDATTLLDALLHRYIESQVYQGVIENLASEQAARMVAMKAATDNSHNLIKQLQLIYNQTRQTNITQELTDIISGAAAVSM